VTKGTYEHREPVVERRRMTELLALQLGLARRWVQPSQYTEQGSFLNTVSVVGADA